MVLARVIETCKERRKKKLGCEGCVYAGKTCAHTINILKVQKPGDYKLNRRKEK